MKFLIIFAILALLSAQITGQRIYARHRRSVDSEGQPAKESTVLIASDANSSDSAASDLPDDLKSHVKSNDKDCKDFFELDYNPRRDMFMFNGQVPNLFRPWGPPSENGSKAGFPNYNQSMNNIHDMFQHMFQQAAHMFNRFPAFNDTPMINHNFPDNYNGTTEETIEMNGRKFLKKQRIVNKNIDGVQVHLISTTYEEIKDETATSALPTGGDNSTTPIAPGSTSGTTPAHSEVEKEDAPRDKKVRGEQTTKPNDLTDGTIVQY